MNEYNDDGQPHGYWEELDQDGVITLGKGYYNNGINEGYWEYYSEWGLLFKGNYKNGDFDGHCVWYEKNGTCEKEFYL